MSTTAEERRRAMLKTAMGPAINEALGDPAVIEVMVNPDGRLWIDRLGEGRSDAGLHVHPSETERIIRLVASHIRAEVHADNPIVSTELPSGERFEGVLPPVSKAPCFAICKPAAKIFTLADYVRAQIMVPIQADALRQAVRERKNILLAGGTSSGKTTLANALLAEIADCDERVLLIEDTRELQCAAQDCVALRTRPGVVSLADLVRSTLRLRPDRISRRRSAWRRSARHAQGLEYRPSGRHRHGACQFGALGALPHRAIGAGERHRHPAPSDRRGDRSRRVHRRARIVPPYRDHRRSDRPRRQWRLHRHPAFLAPTAIPLVKGHFMRKKFRFLFSYALAFAFTASAYTAGSGMP